MPHKPHCSNTPPQNPWTHIVDSEASEYNKDINDVDDLVGDCLDEKRKLTPHEQDWIFQLLCSVKKREDFDDLLDIIEANCSALGINELELREIIALNESSFNGQAVRSKLPFELDSKTPNLIETMLSIWRLRKQPILTRCEGAINTHLLAGVSLAEKLLNYCKTHAAPETLSHIALDEAESCATDIQRGENCKLAALSHAIEHATFGSGYTRPPLYKNGNQDKVSLRQIAKRHGSTVGEIYTINQLLSICQDAQYTAEYFAPNNEEDYVSQLKSLVEIGLTPIVFFDANLELGLREGFPKIGDGEDEHAAIVIGCYTNEENDTRFLVTQWGEFFDFDGMELALSSCGSLLEKRHPESFCKVKIQGKNKWMHEARIGSREVIAKRTALHPKDDHLPLKGKIMTVIGPKLKERASSSMLHFFAQSRLQRESDDLADMQDQPLIKK